LLGGIGSNLAARVRRAALREQAGGEQEPGARTANFVFRGLFMFSQPEILSVQESKTSL